MTEVRTSVTPEELTGALVMEIRETYSKLSRGGFATRCGYPGVARITNIEKKDSWKPGDRETVARVLNEILAAPVTGRKKGETGAERAARLDTNLKQNGHHISTLTIEDTNSFPFELVDDEPPSTISFEQVGSTVDSSTVDDELNEYEKFINALEDDLLNFDGKIVSNSEMQDWLRCRRRWWLSWYRKYALVRRDYTDARSIGLRVHRALASYYVPPGETAVNPREALERAIVEDWTAITQQYADRNQEQLAEAAVKFNESCELERAMVEGYVEWLESEGSDAGLRVIASETGLYADIEVTIDGQVQTFRAVGKIDTRVERTFDDATLLIDHKTVGDFTTARKTLHMNPQMLHYIMLAWLNSEHGISRCDGALYNMLKKVKRTARANPPFFDRIEVRHNPIELENFKSELIGKVHDIVVAEQRLDAGEDHHQVVYPSWRGDCAWDCDFFAVCPMFNDGSRADDMLESLYVKGDPLKRYERVAQEGGN
jgi:hypothetical protein